MLFCLNGHGKSHLSQPPFVGKGQSFLRITLSVLADLGVPVSLPKLEGPSTSVTFLGILINTARMELHLLLDKLSRLRDLVTRWRGRRLGSRSECKSLLGHLSHAAVVINLAGSSFDICSL